MLACKETIFARKLETRSWTSAKDLFEFDWELRVYILATVIGFVDVFGLPTEGTYTLTAARLVCKAM